MKIKREQLYRLRRAIVAGSASLTDETASGVPELFPFWRPGEEYLAGKRVQFEGVLYKVLQNHISQDDWTPVAAPSLFARVLIPDPEVIPEWVQPDSTNPYMAGDKVTHNGKTWVSDVDNNVWEPGVYGWTEVIEE